MWKFAKNRQQLAVFSQKASFLLSSAMPTNELPKSQFAVFGTNGTVPALAERMQTARSYVFVFLSRATSRLATVGGSALTGGCVLFRAVLVEPSEKA